ncbi:MAG: HIRAN domain-containing protein [Coriobacteriia bacterium]|nr:HIRAN domain-containing protein [Coriobacteriia bacterium]
MDKRSKLVEDFYVAGLRYWDAIEVIGDIKVGDKLDIVLESDNQYDPNAIILGYKGKKLGYVPKACNSQISQLLFFGYDIFDAYVSQIRLDAAPEQQLRVAVRLKGHGVTTVEYK